MVNKTSTEKRLEGNEPEKANVEEEGAEDEFATIDGDAIAAATAQMFKGLMGQIQYAAMALANGETPGTVLESIQAKPKETIDVRNLAKEIPVWVQKAYDQYLYAAEELTTNPGLLEWLEHKSCKRKEYYDDFQALQQLTDFYAEFGRFDLGIKAAEKALTITNLHRQGDPDVLSDLNWSLAQLNAANGDMDKAERWLTKCVLMVDPSATSDSETYQGLMVQLKETYQNSKRQRGR